MPTRGESGWGSIEGRLEELVRLVGDLRERMAALEAAVLRRRRVGVAWLSVAAAVLGAVAGTVLGIWMEG